MTPMERKEHVLSMLRDYLVETEVHVDLFHEMGTAELMLLAQEDLFATKLEITGQGTPFQRASLTLSLPDTADTRKLLETLIEQR